LLKGDLVAHQRLAVAGSSKFVEFTVKNASKVHLIQVRTDKKQKLQIRLLDSKGKVLYENTEYVAHKGSRSFTFTPPREGKYKLYVGLSPLGFSTYYRVGVSVYVNDRRLLPRILGRMKFL